LETRLFDEADDLAELQDQRAFGLLHFEEHAENEDKGRDDERTDQGAEARHHGRPPVVVG
jgi:hypothetical protein